MDVRSRLDDDTLRLLGILRTDLRHMPGRHPQASHGNDGPGEIVKGAIGDALNLAGRIDLADNETLASSGRLASGLDTTALFAVVDSPSGRRIRLGFVGNEDADAGRWRAANKGGTADLESAQVRQLHGSLTNGSVRAKTLAKQSDKAWNSDSPPTDPVLLGDAAVLEERIENGWATVEYSIYLDDSDPISYAAGLQVGDLRLRLEPKELRKFLDKLGELT